MRLLTFIKNSLDSIAPKVTNVAETVAKVASVFASLAWLITQALSYLRGKLN